MLHSIPGDSSINPGDKHLSRSSRLSVYMATTCYNHALERFGNIGFRRGLLSVNLANWELD